ncbi:MAG: hypoxanthine phosphoribosyltransferase [Tenericutes bacterium]|nr:hypoxanthine phosphoribosyltransferase [Mycoplasmatota bacterium]
MLEKDIKKVLVSEKQIEEICIKLGKQITKDYEGRNPLVVGLLKGCMPFMAELIKNIDLYMEIELMGVQSYHGGTQSTGDVKITRDLDIPVKGRDIIIAEDIVDTAKTISVISKLLKYRGANSVEVVTLLDKPAGRVVEFSPKYIGVTIPKEFVVGFGLDYDERYRNLPYVGVLKEEIYTK